MKREPPVHVVPYGSMFMVRCTECGDIQQVSSEGAGRDEAWDHQRYEHPTEEEREQDRVRQFEYQEMRDHCPRCGRRGHDGAACPTVTPDLLREDR